MRDALKRLPDPELEIMIILWEAKEPVVLSHISQKLRGKKKYKITAVLSFLTRLTEKGYVKCIRDGEKSRYEAGASERQFLESESKGLFGCHLYNLEREDRDDKV